MPRTLVPLNRSYRWLAPSMLVALLVLTGSAQAPANTQLPNGSVLSLIHI